jgi:hypothetical protein
VALSAIDYTPLISVKVVNAEDLWMSVQSSLHVGAGSAGVLPT